MAGSMFIGNRKIKNVYLTDDKCNVTQYKKGFCLENGIIKQVYSSGNICTYIVDDDISYIEEVDNGSTCLSPKTFIPAKDGWNFVGWREDETASSTVLNTKNMGDDPITLYAVFNQNVTCTIYAGSTTYTKSTKKRYYNNGNYLNPGFVLEAPEVDGWDIYGWNTVLNDNTKSLDDKTTVALAEDTTYYSLYTKTITLTTYNASNTTSTDSATRYYQYNSTGKAWNPSFTLSESDITNWEPIGWNTTKDDSDATVANGSKVTLKSDATYYSLYRRNITLTMYNGSNTATTSSKYRIAQYNGTGKTWNPSFILTENAVSGWTAAGWNVTKDNSTATVANGGTVTLSSNATYYSLYTVGVTISKYDSEKTLKTETKNRIRQYNGTGKIWNPSFTLTNAGLSGWTINGWNTGDNNTTPTVNSGGTVTLSSNATYYALYKGNVTVNFYNNSGSATAQTKTQYVRASASGWQWTYASFQLAQASVSGWTARGWSTSNTGNATINYNNNIAFNRTSGCNLYGLYQKTVTVSYSGNGATGGSTAASTGTAYRNTSGSIVNASITLRGNGFSRTGYSFKGWCTNAAGGTIITTYTGSDNVTVYAQWKGSAFTFASAGYPKSSWSSTGGHTSEGYDADGVTNKTYYRKDIANSSSGTTTWTFSIDRRGCDTFTLKPSGIMINDQSTIKVSCGNNSYTVAMNPSQQNTGTLTFNLANTSNTATLKFEFNTSTNDKFYQFYATDASFS